MQLRERRSIALEHMMNNEDGMAAKCPLCNKEIPAEYYAHMVFEGHFDEIRRMRKALATIYRACKQSDLARMPNYEFARNVLMTIEMNKKKD